MQVHTTIQNFTEIYQEQPFLQDLRNKEGVLWIDCTQINGTDCYCDDEAQAEIKEIVIQAPQPGIHFFDNGNYHYMSKLWTDRVQADFDLVVFDHHPDMQPPRFQGILSCGGWVKEVLDLNPHIKNAVLIGVADHLIEEIKNDPTAEFEKHASQVSFIKESSLSDGEAIQNLDNLGTQGLYISIDKDALCLNDAVTNWDQGSLTFEQLEFILRKLFATHKILGVDICGERARNQNYAEGIDEGIADERNSKLNEKLYNLLQELFKN